MRRWPIFLVLALAAVAVAVAQGRPQGSGVWVSIAIPRYGNAFSTPSSITTRRLSRNGIEDRFAVVIQNRTPKPIELFADGNSWGDGTLSFEITGPDGKTTVAKKQLMAYSKNFPATVYLEPGECWVRTVNYALPTWVGFPNPKGTHTTISMRAILTQAKDGFKNRRELWSGRAISAPVTIEWWGR